MPSVPDIEMANHHPGADFPMDWLHGEVSRVLPLLLERPGVDAPVLLPEFDEVEISLVDDSTISRVHEDFMGVPGATDVITFQHGEILISLDTAKACAPGFGHGMEHEVLLYAIHGLLHLNGYDDIEEGSRRRMHSRQAELLAACRT